MTSTLPLTISERVRRMDAPTEPPRYAVYALLDGEDAACLRRDDDPELAMMYAATELSEWQYDHPERDYNSTLLAQTDRDGPRASLYRQPLHLQSDGTVVIGEPEYLREAKWCAACEAVGHTIAECNDESARAAE